MKFLVSGWMLVWNISVITYASHSYGSHAVFLAQSACGIGIKMRDAATVPVCSICMKTDFIPGAKKNVRSVGA
ncbi:MAG TPA: hypothetical protein DEQ72_07365 [Lachnospiraceae bacterium]|nr:hypothetical protein [Lachnospiraceae bacterium]